LCGITQTYLSQIEGNLKEPNLSTLKAISEKLDMPLPILFFLSMTEDDVQLDKRKAFEIISPSVKSLVNEFFAV
jgi:transcriptional regulator with XRE-family HTH domain